MLPWNQRGAGLVGLVAAARARRDEFRADLNAAAQVALRKVAPAVCVGVGARQFGARWVAERAGDKFRRQAALYLTIPAIAGVLNWATNKLAVWMIFNPESFAGIPVISRARPGEPLGLFGWQGIVPAKVRKMGGSIVDMTINELLDVRSIFSRVDPKKVADLMATGDRKGQPMQCVCSVHRAITIYARDFRHRYHAMPTRRLTCHRPWSHPPPTPRTCQPSLPNASH